MDFWPRHKFLIQKQFLFIFSILIIVIFLSCDDSYNSNSDEIDNNLKNFYWTLQAGTSSNDIVNDIGLDQSGNIYLTGYTQGSLSSTANNGGKDIFLIKYDKKGSLVWKNQIGCNWDGGSEWETRHDWNCTTQLGQLSFDGCCAPLNPEKNEFLRKWDLATGMATKTKTNL